MRMDCGDGRATRVALARWTAHPHPALLPRSVLHVVSPLIEELRQLGAQLCLAHNLLFLSFLEHASRRLLRFQLLDLPQRLLQLLQSLLLLPHAVRRLQLPHHIATQQAEARLVGVGERAAAPRLVERRQSARRDREQLAVRVERRAVGQRVEGDLHLPQAVGASSAHRILEPPRVAKLSEVRVVHRVDCLLCELRLLHLVE
mmetsp:Transcript_46569/g.115498  ORF Transcript_46569/g.115498 Transcript_46569/m.115498 type:complete len:202 (+) Transcript_46569:159-764(+)